MLDEVRRLALFTSGIAELTRNRAESVVRNWVGVDLGNSRASAMARQLVETSERNRRELVRFIRAEMKNQIESLGVANHRDVERLERRIRRLEERVGEGRSGSAASGKKTTRKKTAARTKSTRRRV